MGTIVFSDIAGTIVSGNPWDYVRQHPDFDEGLGRAALRRFIPYYLGWRIKVVSDTIFRDRWLKTMATALRGLSRPTVERIFAEGLEQQMLSMARKDVIARLHEHQRRGDSVVLVSGMFIEMGQVFAQFIGADDVIGSTMAFDGEVATGQIAGKTCVGPRKVEYIKDYLQKKHPDVALEECYGYADSYSDRSLISVVGHGVVTYPEDDMKAYAKAQGWEIMC